MLSKANKIAASLMLFTTTACTTLQPVAEPTTYLSKESPKFVVVTTVDQEEGEAPLFVYWPKYDGSNLSGLIQGENSSIPVVKVRTLKATQVNKQRTTWALIGAGVIAGTLGYLIIANAGDGPASEYDCPPPCRGIPDPALVPR